MEEGRLAKELDCFLDRSDNGKCEKPFCRTDCPLRDPGWQEEWKGQGDLTKGARSNFKAGPDCPPRRW